MTGWRCEECGKPVERYLDCSGHTICSACYGTQSADHWAVKYAAELASEGDPCRKCHVVKWASLGAVLKCTRCGYFGKVAPARRPEANSAAGPQPAATEEPVRWSCATCHKPLRAARRYVGKRFSCPGCQTDAVVPALAPRPIAVARRVVSAAEREAVAAQHAGVMRIVTAAIKAGEATSIVWTTSVEKHELKVRLTETWISLDGPRFPCLSIVALRANDRKSSHPRLILTVGKYAEHLKMKCPSPEVWDAMPVGYSVTNFALPGCYLSSTKEFDDLAKEIRAGAYAVEAVLAMNGRRP